MAIKEERFSYSIKLSFILDNVEYKIDDKNIKTIFINYDFMKAHMPLLVMRAKIDNSIYNNMVRYQSKGKLNLIISKYTEGNKSPKKYISRQFSYYLPASNTGANKVSATTGKSDDDNAFTECAMGLLISNMIAINKQLINDQFTDCNNMTIIEEYMQKFNMVVEPFDNIENHDHISILPLEGISQLLSYLNSLKSFYTTPYRFFMDYKYTYLLSNKGVGLDVKDNTYTSVLIEVTNISDPGTKSSIQAGGIITDMDQHVYRIKVNSGNVDLHRNDLADKSFNRIYAIGSDGRKEKLDVKVNPEEGLESSLRDMIIRIGNGNFDHMKEIQSATVSTGKTISINLSEADGSIFVPYKEFRFIFDTKADKEFDGNYILAMKREIYNIASQTETTTEFKCALNLTFKQVS